MAFAGRTLVLDAFSDDFGSTGEYAVDMICFVVETSKEWRYFADVVFFKTY